MRHAGVSATDFAASAWSPTGGRAGSGGTGGTAGATGTTGADRGEVWNGGVSPARRWTRSAAHWYEMAAPLATMTASGTADQKPITLCQLKSRARPPRPRRNHSACRHAARLRVDGHHR